MAAWDTFRNWDDQTQPPAPYDGRYALLWAYYDGSWLQNSRFAQISPNIYENARLVYKQSDAIVSLYNQFVYAGDLSTDGEYLPDGTRGAIPFDPQVPLDTDKKNLLRAFSGLTTMWQWRQYMSLRPTLGSILGNVLTEIETDFDSGMVVPNTVWPGYVPLRDLDLNYNGDVRAYAVEWHVVIEGRPASAFGPAVQPDQYDYRKEVTPDEVRYYKNGRLHDYPEYGPAVQRNPYGFCPAIWDRHQIAFGEQGISALEGSLNQTLQMNSLFSQTIDYSARNLASPIGVVGFMGGGRKTKRLTMPKAAIAPLTGNPQDEEAAEARAQAEELNLLLMSEKGAFVNVPFDIGQTGELIDRLIEGMVQENPEAQLGKRLLELSQATGPGVDRILSPITGKVRAARKNYDPQTIKLFQMATSMMAHNLNTNYWPSEMVLRRKDRYSPFTVYTLDSYWAGLLDCSIPDRPVFQESLDEKVARLVQINLLMDSADPWLLKEAGVPSGEIDRIIKEKKEREALMDSQLTGMLPDGRPAPGFETPQNEEETT